MYGTRTLPGPSFPDPSAPLDEDTSETWADGKVASWRDTLEIEGGATLPRAPQAMWVGLALFAVFAASMALGVASLIAGR